MDWNAILNGLSSAWNFVAGNAPAFLSGGLIATILTHRFELGRERRKFRQLQLDALASELPLLQGWLDAYYNCQLFDRPAPPEPWPLEKMQKIAALYFVDLQSPLKTLVDEASNLKLWALEGRKQRMNLRVVGTTTLPPVPQVVMDRFATHWYKVDAASKELLKKCGELMKNLS